MQTSFVRDSCRDVITGNESTVFSEQWQSNVPAVSLEPQQLTAPLLLLQKAQEP